MSYSFSITADTKDEAGVKVEAALEQVVGWQPTHAKDRQAAQDATEALVAVLADPAEGQCVAVYVSGSLSWRGDDEFVAANLSVRASLVAKA